MNDAYVGDIGDYGKYGLLKTLKQETGYQLGVVWMKTASPVFEYLEQEELVACDPELYQSLRGLVRGSRRTIAGLEESDALPADTIYFNKQFVFRGKKDQQRLRREWFGEALDRLKDSNLVLFDPDNGLETSEKKKESMVEGPKNLRYEELRPFYERGKSLVVYQHAERRKGGMKETIRVRTSDLKRELGCKKIWALRWHRVQSRVYFLIPTLEHRASLEMAIHSFEETKWCTGGQFTVQEI